MLSNYTQPQKKMLFLENQSTLVTLKIIYFRKDNYHHKALNVLYMVQLENISFKKKQKRKENVDIRGLSISTC